MGTAVNLLVTIFLLISANNNGGASANSCQKTCTPSDGDKNVLHYKNGEVYEYAFDSVLKVQSDGGGSEEGDSTALKVAGVAKVFSLGNCGYTLQLAGVKVTAVQENLDKQFPAGIIQKPVYFTLQSNGELEPQLCADAGDTEYSLNIKRAIISLLQASTKSTSDHETDVFGQCDTHTVATESNGGANVVVNKMRNLQTCAYREQLHSGIIAGVVNENAGVHSSMLLLHADYNREVQIANGIVSAVSLTEHYKYAAVRKNAPHVRASVLTNLKLRNGGAGGNPPPMVNSPVSIVFQKPDVLGTKNLPALKAQMNEIIQHSTDYVQKDSAKAFVELIRLMRNSDADTLIKLSNEPHPNKVLARKVYLDALFRAATKESARAILTQLNNLDDKEKAIALLSLNLVQVIDGQTLQQAANLLNANAPKEVFLVIGNLVSKYCRSHECVATDKAIEVISKKLVDNLKHCRAATRKDEDRIVSVLKGIANSGNGHLDVNLLVPALNECIVPTNSMRIRVNALQTYASAASCNPQLHQQGIQLLRNRNEDSELRIEAYLAVTTCPTADVANQLAEIVNSETVYQVGGFITSHLKALRDSTDATREQQRHHLGNIRVTKHFPTDPDRYSYNSEISYKLQALGLSASVDTKVIYSQQGFLPRSTRLNVTTEFFGTDFNVLDANVRQQNLEYILEYYLGPKGLANQDLKDIMKNAEGNSRGRRSIADETAKMAKKYKSFGNKNVFDINLDVSLKLFSSEIFFLSLGDRIPTNFKEIISHFSNVQEKAKHELNNFERQFQTHCLFLDTKLQYTTGIGVPLELSIQGLAANRLDVALNLDVDSLLQQDWSNAKPRIKLVPSIDVNVHLQLGFDAYVLQTGVRLDSTFHSADGADVTITAINEANGLNFAIELPREKIELIDVEIQRNFYVAEQDKPLRSLAPKHDKKTEPMSMCFNQLDTLGFNFCVVTSFEDPLEIGVPYKLSVHVTSERHINVRAYHVAEAPNGSEQFKVEYTTPGSQVPHNAAVTLEIATEPRVYARIEFEGNNKRAAGEIGLSKTNEEVAFYAQVEHNGQKRRSRIGFLKHGNEYRPVIEVFDDNNGVRNDINGYRADGRIIVQDQGDEKHIQFENFQVNNPKGERLVLNGVTDLNQDGFNSDLHFGVGQRSYAIKSHLQFQHGQGYGASFFINDERTPQNVWGASANVRDGDEELNLDVVIKAHVYELHEIHKLAILERGDDQTATSVNWSNEFSVNRQQQPLLAGKLTGSWVGHSKLHVQGELSHGKKHGSLSLQLDHGGNFEKPFTLSTNAKYSKHFVDVQVRGQPTGAQRLRIDGGISSSLGTAITYKGEVGQRATLQDVHIDLSGNLQLTARTKALHYVVKINGAPDHTNSELQLTQDGGAGTLFSYVGSWTHAQDRINGGKLQLHVSDTLEANGEFKVAKNGKGELNGVVKTLKTSPPHEISVGSKFHLQAPKYDFEVSVNYDGAQQLHVKTENVLDKVKLNSKNVLELANGKQVKLDVHGAVKGEWVWNGELTGNFQLHTACGHVIDGDLKRKIQTNPKTAISHGTLDLQLNDQLPEGQGKRSLGVHMKLDQLNWQQRNIVEDVLVNYVSKKGEEVKVAVSLKHVPVGGGKEPLKKFELNTKIDGSLLQNIAPISVNVAIDDYSTTQARYNVQAAYGSTLQAQAQGNYHVSTRGEPSTFDISANVQAPQTKFKRFELTANGKLLLPRQQQQKTKKGNNGPFEVELHVNEHLGDDQHVRLNVAAKGSRVQGNYKLELDTSRLPAPLSVNGDYHHELHTVGESDDATSGKHTYNFELRNGERHARSQAIVEWHEAHDIELHYTLDSSKEEARNVRLHVKAYKLPDDSSSYALLVEGQRNDQQGKIDATIYRGDHKRGIALTINLPRQSQPIKVVAIGELLGERKGKLTIDVDQLFDIDVKANADAGYASIDDFHVQAHWQSQRLQLIGYELSVTAKNKQVQLLLKNAKGVIISGNAAYALKNEQNKAIIEGQGQFQWHDKTQPINFKLVRQVYELQADKEVGVSYTINGNLGNSNGVSTLKLTSKEFNVKLSICEERKQCTNLQLQSNHALVNSDGAQQGGVQHSFLMLLDLRELGYPYEFELQSRTIRHGLKVQYNLDASAISSVSQRKYQLNAQWRPQGGHVLLHLPEREVVFETKRERPNNGIFGHYENSFNFWLDKGKQPQDVISVVASGDVNGDAKETQLNAHGVLKFQHPKVRTLSITGRLEATQHPTKVVDSEIVFDIFRLPEQQVKASSRWRNTLDAGGVKHGFNITSEQRVVSQGLNWKYDLNSHVAFDAQRLAFSNGVELHTGATNIDASYYLTASRDRVELYAHALNEELVSVIGEFGDRQQRSSKWHATLQLFGQSPLVIVREVQPSHAKLTVQRANNIDFAANLEFGKQFNVQLNGRDKQQLLQGHVALDAANFLHTTYTSDKPAIQNYWASLRDSAQAEAQVVRQKLHERFQQLRLTLSEQRQLAKQSLPDFTALKQSYTEHANAIVKELEKDEALKQLIQSYHEIYNQLIHIIDSIVQSGSKIYEELHNTFVALHGKVEDLLENVVLPAWEEFLTASNQIVGELRDNLVVIYTQTVEFVLGQLEHYGPKLKEYLKASGEVLRPIADALHELQKTLVQLSDELIEDLKAYIAQLPTLEQLRADIREHLEQLQLSERILRFVHELFGQLHVLPQTPEVTEFLQRTQAYFEHKLKQQSVDDEHEIDELLSLLVQALRSIWVQVVSAAGGDGSGASAGAAAHAAGDAVSHIGAHGIASALFGGADSVPHVFDRIGTLLSFRFSVFNYLLNEDFGSHLHKPDHLAAWLQSLTVELHAHIIDGQHLITFDERYHDIQNANCRYILAQDSVDNNFTVVAQLNNNKLKTITLTDRNGNFLELNDAGVLKANGQVHEYPWHDGDMHAWRKYYTLQMRSAYGVEVHCTSDLKICHILVDLFYQSKLRGLLGNANAEPFDDLMKPDGRQARDIVELSTSYALGGKCQPIVAAAENVAHADICNELFGYESSLITGYLFVAQQPYRHACDVAVANAADKDKDANACNVATAYASALRVNGVAVSVPTRCLKCSGPGVAANQRDLGSEFTVKIPNNKADVVFIVDMEITAQLMQTLVAPAITEVRESLKTRGLTDVQIGVIAYNNSQQYPALLTSDNGKLNYANNLGSVELNGPLHPLQEYFSTEDISLGMELDVAFHTLQMILQHAVSYADEMAYRMALNYPFRSGAAKSVVVVTSEPLQNGSVLRLLRARLNNGLTQNELPTVNFITPVKDLKLEGVNTERIIGFNSRIVALVDGKDARKRSKLQYQTNYVIDQVLENNGWIFAADSFQNLKAGEQQKARSQFVNVIADTLFKTEITSDCQCAAVFGGLHAQHRCVVKSSNFVPNKKPKVAA